ncbi:MAG: hypothetical protein FWD52_04990 [Candidatus Bathyarchaeota archaeon]|nr:hypothetical protein [Candidatus Termiticorpusculum sp.]
MNINIKSTFKVSRRKLPLITLLVAVVLIVSLFVYIFTVERDNSFLEIDVYVSTEFELRDVVDTAVGSTCIALEKDISLTSALNITAGKDISLTSNSTTGFYKLIGANHESTLIVENGSVLRLGGIVVTHTFDDRGRGVTVNPGGTLFMNDGEISGNTSYDNYGGGVYNRGSFTMTAGKISGNTIIYRQFVSFRSGGIGWESFSGGYGGGVYNVGVFEMSGGVISGNTGAGGGVYNTGDFELLGGMVYGNKRSEGVDSNVYSAEDSIFNKRGGVVFGNVGFVGTVICGSIIMGVFALLCLDFKKKMGRRVSVV